MSFSFVGSFFSIPVYGPTGCIVGRNDPYMVQSQFVLRDKYPNIVHYNLANDGGHFLAMEHPEILAQDVIQFVQTVEKL